MTHYHNSWNQAMQTAAAFTTCKLAMLRKKQQQQQLCVSASIVALLFLDTYYFM